MELYKRTKTGAIQVWEIIVEGNKYRTVEGQIEGVRTTSAWTVCKGKNIGRSNETSPEEQAQLEARAKQVKKLDNGYTHSLSLIDVAKLEMVAPMLAFEYEKMKGSLIGKRRHCQPKLDGMRMVKNENGKFSRGGKPVISVPHFDKELAILEEEINLPCVIDGEIYNHLLKEDFNKIISYAKKTKPSESDLQISEEFLGYHIYDMQLPEHKHVSFVERFQLLEMIFEKHDFKYLKLVETIEVESDEHLDELYGKFLEEGYEGQMVRASLSAYENNRSKSLLKRKEMITEEFEIVDVEEGNGERAGMAGGIVLKDRVTGKVFNSNIKGDREYYKMLLLKKKDFIGKSATCKYQNLTPDGIPRFPVIININREEYE